MTPYPLVEIGSETLAYSLKQPFLRIHSIALYQTLTSKGKRQGGLFIFTKLRMITIKFDMNSESSSNGDWQGCLSVLFCIFLLFILCEVAHLLIKRKERQEMDAHMHFVEIAQRLLPQLNQRAELLAKSLQSAPITNLIPQTIEYPCLYYCFKPIDFSSFNKRRCLIIYFQDSKNFDMTNENQTDTRDPGTPFQMYGPEIDFTFLKSHLPDRGSPDVDISRVKSIVIELRDFDNSQGYGDGEGHVSFTEWNETHRIYVIDNETSKVTASHLFSPRVKFPYADGPLSQGDDDTYGNNQVISDEQQQQEQEAWLQSLPSNTSNR